MTRVLIADGTPIRRAIDNFLLNHSGNLNHVIYQLENDPNSVASNIFNSIEDRFEQLEEAGNQLSTGKTTAIHVQNVFFPPRNLCDTPLDFIPIPNEPGTIKAQLAVTALVNLADGCSISYKSENSGALFVNLTTISGEGRLAEKSLKSMRGHTDAVSFPFPRPCQDNKFPSISPAPDLLCLVCLRNTDETQTRLIPLEDVLKKLGEDTIRELEKEQFTIQCQNTFSKGTNDILGEIHHANDVSILQKNEINEYMVRYSHSKATADHDNASALNALKNFQNAISSSITEIKLEPGDVVIINNRKALHGRGEQKNKSYGEQTRWLLRSYGLFNKNTYKEYFYSRSKFMLYP